MLNYLAMQATPDPMLQTGIQGQVGVWGGIPYMKNRIIRIIRIIRIEGLSLLQSIPPTTANSSTKEKGKRG